MGETALRAHGDPVWLRRGATAEETGRCWPEGPEDKATVIPTERLLGAMLCSKINALTLHIVSLVCICQSQSPNSSHPPLSPLVSIRLFSTSVTLFLLMRTYRRAQGTLLNALW